MIAIFSLKAPWAMRTIREFGGGEVALDECCDQQQGSSKAQHQPLMESYDSSS